MGYRGKLAERNRARDLRAEGYKLYEIAEQLGVSKSSVSLWVRDVDFVPRDPEYGRRWRPGRKPSSLSLRKQQEIERLLAEGREKMATLSEREHFVAGVALYAGEGSKTDGEVAFTNTNSRMHVFFLDWFRRFFDVDESRLHVRLYLHEGLDLDAALEFWSQLTRVPVSQFWAPYRAKPDPSIRLSKHPMGCPKVSYGCSRTHRTIMGLVNGLLSFEVPRPG